MPSNVVAALMKLGPKPVDGNNKPSALDVTQQRKELYTYRPFRYVGFVTALASLAFGLYAVINKDWIKAQVTPPAVPSTQYIGLGIWDTCYTELRGASVVEEEEVDLKDLCNIRRIAEIPKWQSAVVGLLLFSLALGFMASILTTCGLCSINLAKKVYYYHSAGEMYFVCGVCATSALVAYPTVMQTSKEIPIHELGVGYYLAWGMPACYFVAAFLMTLDDMIHSLSNECCLMCRAKSQKTTRPKPAAV